MRHTDVRAKCRIQNSKKKKVLLELYAQLFHIYFNVCLCFIDNRRVLERYGLMERMGFERKMRCI